MDRSGIPGFSYADVDFEGDVPGPPPLFGDFYREFDDVTRGVNLPVAQSSEAWDSSMLKGIDPYSDREDVTRSVSLHPDFGYLDSQPYDKLGLLEPPGFGELAFQKNAFLTDAAFGSSGACKGGSMSKLSSTTQFTEIDQLPPAPTDPLFSFTLTTLIVLCESPHKLMNHFLEFLTLQVAAEILKTSRKKFCVKADVFLDNMMCTLKVRAYQQEPGQVAFEFQRRSGDTITFNGIYQKAAVYLSGHHPITGGMPEAAAQPQTAASLPKGKVQVAALQPILELARQENSPELQAEAASAMSSWAEEDGETADAFCTDVGVFEAVIQLLKTDRVDVCYPTAKLLLQLACSHSAIDFFFGAQLVDRGLLQILLEKVQCCSPLMETSMVQQLLLQVIVAAVRNCALRLPEQQASLLTDQITKAMMATSKERSDIMGSLQEAYLFLMQRR
jgi:hypothetical protein